MVGNNEDLARILIKYPLNFCTTCFFGNPKLTQGKVNNGTVTLLEYKGEKYGITNHHVIDEYRKRLAEDPEVHLYLGNARIDLDSVLFDEDETLDVCILYLQGYTESQIAMNGEVPTKFFPVGERHHVSRLVVGDFVLFGGYPGVWRVRFSELNIQFDTLSSGGSEVADVTDMNIRCELKLDQCTTISEHGHDFPDNLGGLSGGPVFHHSLTDIGISKFEFIGVIYEHIPLFDSVLIRPASVLDENMWIIR
ncbi:hypothetical protein [Vibrio pectenicida]|uniref:Serine protease n=1 Tax=Vibrio pectenicida TaxID=62763 RepID=A0A427U848_9VIBR|nr:hypothetical protein [Vibrio pectenicida]RSD32890.1 hypothetical protein EJA03_01150 [Vibrio pectenicida]